MLTAIVFYILATLCVVTAVLTVTLANPVTCALSLIACLMCLAGLFAQLSAGYVAILQVLVYAGAIMVLFLFVVMLLNLTREEADEGTFGTARALTSLVCVAFLLDLYVFVDAAVGTRDFTEALEGFGSLAGVGEALFSRYLVPFEVISLLLTAAVVGVVAITRRQLSVSKASEPLKVAR
ncbi:MAG: NADH-quinone oxidoreductase subunit J [Candidatus Wallbacteria bacterium]|nr:NADH-quinone oxidoreductase subunit J [Candidatus Wallbacteria bacterium]